MRANFRMAEDPAPIAFLGESCSTVWIGRPHAFGAGAGSLAETQTRNPADPVAVARSRVYREVFIWPIHKFAARMVSVK